MNSLLLCVVLSLILCETLARPQNDFFGQQQFQGNPFLPPNNNQGNGGNNIIQPPTAATTPAPTNPASTAAPSPRTTASPRYLSCLQGCPSTMEYNPICGSDMISYHNNGRLTCAQRCGKNVAALRAGTCNPLT